MQDETFSKFFLKWPHLLARIRVRLGPEPDPPCSRLHSRLENDRLGLGSPSPQPNVGLQSRSTASIYNIGPKMGLKRQATASVSNVGQQRRSKTSNKTVGQQCRMTPSVKTVGRRRRSTFSWKTATGVPLQKAPWISHFFVHLKFNSK